MTMDYIRNSMRPVSFFSQIDPSFSHFPFADSDFQRHLRGRRSQRAIQTWQNLHLYEDVEQDLCIEIQLKMLTDETMDQIEARTEVPKKQQQQGRQTRQSNQQWTRKKAPRTTTQTIERQPIKRRASEAGVDVP